MTSIIDSMRLATPKPATASGPKRAIIAVTSVAPTGTMMLVPAAGMLLLSEKGMALFGLTGLLGDALSYARLMALGLVSFGLAVAIPAVMAFNFFMHKIRVIESEMNNFSSDFLNIIERDFFLERRRDR